MRLALEFGVDFNQSETQSLILNSLILTFLSLSKQKDVQVLKIVLFGYRCWIAFVRIARTIGEFIPVFIFVNVGIFYKINFNLGSWRRIYATHTLINVSVLELKLTKKFNVIFLRFLMNVCFWYLKFLE